MKKLVSITIIIISLWMIFNGISAFDNAQDWMHLFIGMFWMAMGSLALHGSIDDIKKNKWPF